jgi:hypothetical protein
MIGKDGFPSRKSSLWAYRKFQMTHDFQNIVDDLKRDAHVKAVAVGR